MATQQLATFSPEIPADVEHVPLIREEALDWLETHHAGDRVFTTGELLTMAGESQRRWLISRLRSHGIADEAEITIPAAADALAVLFLRSRGVKFRDAVDAVVGRKGEFEAAEPRYGGVWNRLIDIALKRIRRRLAARLLGSAAFSLIRDPERHANTLVIVKLSGGPVDTSASGAPRTVSSEDAYLIVLERPAPSCWVLSPLREVLYLDVDQLPSRAELRARHFVSVHVQTAREGYEVFLGTLDPTPISSDDETLEFVGRIFDFVFLDFQEFLQAQSAQRFETAILPGVTSSDDLQLWLITQLLTTAYPGSLCAISEVSASSEVVSVLASSVTRPWEPSPRDPPGTLEMLSGYSGRIGIPLVVETVEEPWTSLIESVEPEMRYLASITPADAGVGAYSAIALPIPLSSGESLGSLYVLMPRVSQPRLNVEVRVLTVLSRIIGEVVERQRGAIQTANVSEDIATLTVLPREQFRTALLDLLGRKADELGQVEPLARDMRLPFLLLSAHSPDPDEFDPVISGRLKDWLIESLHHLEWRSFLRSHLPGGLSADSGAEDFISELPGAGMVIALDQMVTKDELDRIRDAFPTSINRVSPPNSPVKLVAWILDVPAQRILDASREQGLDALAGDVEQWAFDVATVVDDVAQSYFLAHDDGEWDSALGRIRRALRKEGGRKNGYLYRLAAECCFSLADWPGALRYAQQGVAVSGQELGSGFVRSMCQEGDAHLFKGDPFRAWDLYSEAALGTPNHPLPRYYRGQALILMAKLLHEFEDERLRTEPLPPAQAEQLRSAMSTLVDGAMEDLTSAADLLDQWGLIPEPYQYRNFHLVPTLLGQGLGYLLDRAPGPAASRLQSARRKFPKDDLFFREFVFAKCWEQGLHRRYGELILSEGWSGLTDRMSAAYGELRWVP